MEQILLTMFKQFLVFTKWLKRLTLFTRSSVTQNYLPNTHIINDPFLTDYADLTFIKFIAFIAHSCNQRDRLHYMIQTRALLGCHNCLKEGFKLDVTSYKQRCGVAGISSSICLPIAYFYQEAPSLDCYRVSQNAVIAVIGNSFKATDRLSEKLKVQSWGKPYYGRCRVWKIKTGAACVPKKRQHSGAPSGLKDSTVPWYRD